MNNSYDTIVNKKNTLARNLYEQLFTYLIEECNKKLNIGYEDCKTITILDIFGFENLERNTFDQFCINWANEKIQDDYVKRTFVNLQNMYKEEGVHFDDIKYNHNGSLQLFERQCGIVDLINEESLSRFGNVNNLSTKIKNYCKDVIVDNNIFQINHFATDVKYDLTGFITKNNETGLNFNDIYKMENNVDLKSTIKNTFITHLLSNDKKSTIKKPTVLKTFKRSLDDLFESINNSKILYVRCIKPNSNKTNVFDDKYVLNQLKISGIIETIEISKKTYSHYVFNEDYDERYAILPDSYNIKRGKNRIFLTNETLYKLEQDRNTLFKQYKQIISSVIKSKYEQKALDNNRTIIKLVINKYYNEYCSNFSKKRQELYHNQKYEQIEENQEKAYTNKSDKNLNKIKHNMIHNKCDQLRLDNLLESENIDKFDSDLNNNDLTAKISIVNDNQEECNNKNDYLTSTDISSLENKNDYCKIKGVGLINKNVENYKCTKEKTKHKKNGLIDSEYRFDEKEIRFIDSKKFYKINKGDFDMDTGKQIDTNVQGQRNNEENVSELLEKLKRYEKFCKAPCRNCKAMEIKYKYQTEELKRKKAMDLEIETYKKKIADLEKEVQKLSLKNKENEPEENKEEKKMYKVFVKDNFVISFTSPYDVFGYLIELFIDFCPEFTSTFLPKNEALAFAQIVYQTMYKLNKNGESMKELTDMFVHELKERFIVFEREINKVCFISSNIIELKRIFICESKTRLDLTEISNNEIKNSFDDVFTTLYTHICELLKKNLQDLLPDTIILHQELKEFYCKERYFSSFFGKPPSICKLLEALEYSVSILQHYHLPDQAWEECINYLLKTINSKSFNGMIVKNDFLSFNRGMQINNNLNKIEKFCREIGFPEGVHNLEHMKDVVKLINYVKAGQKIDAILNGCSYLNFLQVIELLGKFKKSEKEYLAKDLKNYICKDVKLEKFVNESKLNVFLNYGGVKHKFLVPRYVPSKYIQSILESL